MILTSNYVLVLFLIQYNLRFDDYINWFYQNIWCLLIEDLLKKWHRVSIDPKLLSICKILKVWTLVSYFLLTNEITAFDSRGYSMRLQHLGPFEFTLCNFFLTVSFIVSVKVGIFTLNMRNIIIYIADDGRSICRNVAHLNILVHDMVNLLYDEYWTDKQNYLSLY